MCIYNQTKHTLISNTTTAYHNINDMKFSYNSKRFIVGTAFTSGKSMFYIYAENCPNDVCDAALGETADGLGGCQFCNVTLGIFCTLCSSRTVCTQCKTTLYYYLNSSSNQCETCQIP